MGRKTAWTSVKQDMFSKRKNWDVDKPYMIYPTVTFKLFCQCNLWTLSCWHQCLSWGCVSLSNMNNWVWSREAVGQTIFGSNKSNFVALLLLLCSCPWFEIFPFWSLLLVFSFDWGDHKSSWRWTNMKLQKSQSWISASLIFSWFEIFLGFQLWLGWEVSGRPGPRHP